MGDLLRRQPVVQAEARHVGAGREGVGVVDLFVDVLDRVFIGAADLAEMMQAGADGAVGDFLLGQFMAGVAVAAAHASRRVRLDEADVAAGADRSELLAFLPVADQLAVHRVADGGGIQLFQLLADLARRVVAILLAGLHRFVLLQAGHPVLWIFGLERGAEHLLGFLGILAARCFGGFLGEGRGGQGKAEGAEKGKFQFHGRLPVSA